MQPEHALRAQQRARWYSELTIALREAEKLLSLLETEGGFPAKTARLRTRIQMVQSDIAKLNHSVADKERVVGEKWPSPEPDTNP